MKIVFTPDWFLTSDILIEVFSFFVLIAFFILSVRNYNISKKKSTLYLGGGFFLIAFAELCSIFTKFVLYYNTTFTQQIGQMIITYNLVHTIDVCYYLGFFFSRFLTLLGLYIIYKIPSKEKGTAGDFILAFCFILISSLFSNLFYYIFHITAILLIGMIIANYTEIYKKNKFETTKTLLVAFWILLASHIILLLSKIQIIYVAGQLIQLVSYIILLILIVRITKNGKKKKSQ